jgi:type IV pilus assembly protein PilC
MFERITTKDVALFTRQFAAMIKAGLPIVRCLEILREQIKKNKFRLLIHEVMHDVETGSTLYEAMSRHKQVFNPLYVSMIKAGETGGFLDVSLNRIANWLDKSEALKRKIMGAMAYPAVIFAVAIGITAFMLLFIIPTFAEMFENLGAELPAMTQMVIGFSAFIRHRFILIIMVIVALFFGFYYYSKNNAGRAFMDRLLFKVPLFGPIVSKSAISRFARTLSSLTTSGVPILQGLEITATTSGNKVVEDAVISARKSISAGKTIADPLKKSGIFPPMVTQLVAVGEESGNLPEMLDKVADFYDAEVDSTVGALASIIEPITIVLMGGIVGLKSLGR